MTLEPAAVDPATFRRALGSFASGVTVVSTRDDYDRPVGMTVTAFSSVSAAPLMVLICLNRSTRTHANVTARRRFGVNVLGEEAVEISAHCARPGGDKTLHRSWLKPSDCWGSPALRLATAFLDCQIGRIVAAGTHDVLFGEVTGIGLARDSDPLLHYRGAHRRLAPVPAGTTPRPLEIVLEDLS